LGKKVSTLRVGIAWCETGFCQELVLRVAGGNETSHSTSNLGPRRGVVWGGGKKVWVEKKVAWKAKYPPCLRNSDCNKGLNKRRETHSFSVMSSARLGRYGLIRIRSREVSVGKRLFPKQRRGKEESSFWRKGGEGRTGGFFDHWDCRRYERRRGTPKGRRGGRDPGKVERKGFEIVNVLILVVEACVEKKEKKRIRKLRDWICRGMRPRKTQSFR